jgi:hypothetical protein
MESTVGAYYVHWLMDTFTSCIQSPTDERERRFVAACLCVCVASNVLSSEREYGTKIPHHDRLVEYDILLRRLLRPLHSIVHA